MAAFFGFSPDTFGFLQALALNNNREWFEAHRSDYDGAIVTPALALISDMADILKKISPHYQAVAKRSGGSLMRIYRDTRFSHDKTPYKTNVGIQFRHDGGADVHAPGYYLHLAIGECFVGVGTWRPEAPDLLRIRQAIAGHPAEYGDAVHKSTRHSGLSLTGDSLKKTPRGFPADHPLADELRRIDFLLSADLAPEQYLDRGLVDLLEQKFRDATPYMQFLCKALGAEF